MLEINVITKHLKKTFIQCFCRNLRTNSDPDDLLYMGDKVVVDDDQLDDLLMDIDSLLE